jgi:uncharacterized protein (DUF849 family)
MTGFPLLTVAPNGARRGRCDHPALPVTTAQIAACAKACFTAGADQIHLHVRDAQGEHSLDAGRYRAAIAAIAELAPALAVQVTTEAAGKYDVAAQYACLQALRPRAASVALRETARDPVLAARLYAFAAEAGIQVQHILYTPADLALLAAWMANGIVPPHLCSVLFVLGSYQPPRLAQPAELSGFLTAMQGKDLDWSVCAFGRNELACARAALRAGGSIRIGFENNIHLPDGRLARNNAENIALARAMIDEVSPGEVSNEPRLSA